MFLIMQTSINARPGRFENLALRIAVACGVMTKLVLDLTDTHDTDFIVVFVLYIVRLVFVLVTRVAPRLPRARFGAGVDIRLKPRRSAMQTFAHRAIDRHRRVNWAALRQKSLWALPNLAVTLIPLVVIALGLLAFALVPPLRQMSSADVMGALWSAIPFIALKTRFGMRRVFTFTPELLQGFGKKIMIIVPILAVVFIAVTATQMNARDLGRW